MTKKTVLTIVAVSVLSGGVVAATNAFAQTTSGQSNSIPSLAQEIADKFHLHQSDVQSTIDQHNQQIQAKMEANYENYLGKLLTKGKITQGQEQLLIAKHKEIMGQLQSNKTNFKNMTVAQRRAQIQSLGQDIQNWAKQNNIPVHYLHLFGMRRWGFRFGMHTAVIPTPTP